MEIKEEDFKKYIAILGDREEYCLFSGRPEWDDNRKVYAIPETSPRKKTEWVKKEALKKILEENIRRGWTSWISLNEKEKGKDSIEGTNKIWCIWFDFDAKREDKSKPASEEEKGEALDRALKFRGILEEFGLRGFIACSGNGYHLFYPLNGFELRGSTFRKEFNEKLRKFYNNLRKKTEIEFDTTTDIRRVTQPIGYPNMKIPEIPLSTFWVDSFGIEDIKDARKRNEALIDAILNISLKDEKEEREIIKAVEFDELLKSNEKVRDLYEGRWVKYKYKSRSEAEQALVTILCIHGFSDDEIKMIMKSSEIGKWREKQESYHDLTIRKGREYAKAYLMQSSEKIEKEKSTETKKSNEKSETKKTEKRVRLRVDKEEKELLLRDLMSRYIFVTLEDTDEIYVYDNGIYKQGEVLIKKEIERAMGEDASSYFVSEILDHIRRRTYVPRSLFNIDKNFLPVKNGLLHLTEFKLYPFDPSKIFTYQLPVEYDPSKDCVHIRQFMEDVVRAEDIPTVQEFLGYCLYPDLPAHKTLWLYGTGRNGKTTFVNLLKHLVGNACVASVTLDELDGWHRFSIVRLFGKLVNIIPEPSTMRAMNTVDFKRLTGGDFVSAEVKNKQKTVDFVNFAKFIIYGNKFPIIRDPSPAFWSRLIVIGFPNTFDKNAIPNYDRVLINKDGLSGFLNWCLEGLKRLRANNFMFTTSKTSEELKTEFIKQSDSVRAFVRERCIFSSSAFITKEELYAAYKEFCEAEGLTIRGIKTFAEIISEIPRVYSKHKKIGDKIQRCWFGIELKKEEVVKEKEEEEEKEVFECICGVKFDNIYDLKGHQLICKKFKEQTKRDLKICIYCGREFTTADELIEHIKSSERENLMKLVKDLSIEEQERYINNLDWRAFDDNYQKMQIKEKETTRTLDLHQSEYYSDNSSDKGRD